MAHKINKTAPKSWNKHLRPWMKRNFWKRFRKENIPND